MTERTPIGRKMQQHVRAGGGPLLRVKAADLMTAGVEHVQAKTVGVQEGKPMIDGGRVLDVQNVIWCTGFSKDTDWIELPITGEDGFPEQGSSCLSQGCTSSVCPSFRRSLRCSSAA